MRLRISIVVLSALVAAACAGSTPVTPTPSNPTTDTFTGTLQPQTTNTHDFTVAQSGELDVTLAITSLPVALGLGVGQPSTAAGCLLLHSVSTAAGSTPQITGTATVSGNFCVAIYDVGNMTDPVDYTITVTHQ